MTRFIMPKRKFCQEFILYHCNAVFHSYLELLANYTARSLFSNRMLHKIPTMQLPFFVNTFVTISRSRQEISKLTSESLKQPDRSLSQETL